MHLGVKAGDAANRPIMHRTTSQQGMTQSKMSTVPKERNFGPKRRSQIIWRDQSKPITLLRKHSNKCCIYQWWSRQHGLHIFYSFLPRHHDLGKAKVHGRRKMRGWQTLDFFLTSPHNCTEFLYIPSASSASTSSHLTLEPEMILPPELKHFPQDWYLEGIGRKKAMEAGQ